MQTSLLTYLASVPDFRRGQGKRYALAPTLAMLIMGIMSGRHGYRELASFLKANDEELRRHFGIKRTQMPSHVTVRTILRELDFAALCEAFGAWATETIKLNRQSQVIIDGKALAATVNEPHSSLQEFIGLVSAFVAEHGSVIGLQRYENADGGEQPSVEQLITALGLSGVTFSLDALHCQKKRSRAS